jgi:uncharacterized membrane protein
LKVSSERSPLDLVTTLALALAGLALALLPVATWARAVALLPLVFALPGYAAICALIPSNTFATGERTVYAVALSITICALSGALAQLVVRLDRTTWAVMLTAVTVAAAGAGLWRRRPLAWPARSWSRIAAAAPGSAVAIIAAAGIAALAIVIASDGARRTRADAHFTELWALPQAGSSAGADAVLVGVRNHEGVAGSYVLQVPQGTLLRSEPIRVAAGATLQTRVPAPGNPSAGALDVTLYREGHIYRQVHLDGGGPA